MDVGFKFTWESTESGIAGWSKLIRKRMQRGKVLAVAAWTVAGRPQEAFLCGVSLGCPRACQALGVLDSDSRLSTRAEKPFSAEVPQLDICHWPQPLSRKCPLPSFDDSMLMLVQVGRAVCCPGDSCPVSSWFWQSGPGPEAMPVGPGRGQKHHHGLREPGECGLLQGLHPGQGPAALDTGCARQRQR